jgi:hypothetical protein
VRIKGIRSDSFPPLFQLHCGSQIEKEELRFGTSRSLSLSPPTEIIPQIYRFFLRTFFLLLTEKERRNKLNPTKIKLNLKIKS